MSNVTTNLHELSGVVGISLIVILGEVSLRRNTATVSTWINGNYSEHVAVETTLLIPEVGK